MKCFMITHLPLKWVVIGWVNGSSSVRCQAIIYTNDGFSSIAPQQISVKHVKTVSKLISFHLRNCSSKCRHWFLNASFTPRRAWVKKKKKINCFDGTAANCWLNEPRNQQQSHWPRTYSRGTSSLSNGREEILTNISLRSLSPAK